MDQNDMLSTQTNTNSGYEFAAHSTNINASTTNFNYIGEVNPNYTNSESVIDIPINTDCNVITDTYQYDSNFLTPNNYYENSSLPSKNYQKLDSENVEYDETTGYENFIKAEMNTNQTADSYLQVPDSEISSNNSVHYDSIKEEHKDFILKPEHIDIPLSTTGENLTDTKDNFEKSVPSDHNQHDISGYEQPDASIVPSNNSENTKNVVCFTDPAIEIKPEVNSEISVLEDTLDVPKKEIKSDLDDTCKTEASVEILEHVKPEEELQITDIKQENTAENQAQVQEETHEDNSKNATNCDKFAVKPEIQNVQMCIRNGCVNRAINNPEWEQEFCSNDCVITHCRNVFMAWVKANEVLRQ